MIKGLGGVLRMLKGLGGVLHMLKGDGTKEAQLASKRRKYASIFILTVD